MDIESRRQRDGSTDGTVWLDEDPIENDDLAEWDNTKGVDGLDLYYDDNGDLGGGGDRGDIRKSKYEGISNVDDRRKRKNRIATLVVFIVVFIISIVVGVVVSKNKNSSSINNIDNTNTEFPSADTTNKTDPPASTNDGDAINNATDAPTKQNQTETPATTNQTEAFPDGNQTSKDENFVMPYLDPTDGVVTYSSDVGPFTVEIPTLASTDVGVYEKEKDVADGLSRMALFLLNNIVSRIIDKPGFDDVGHGGGGVRDNNRNTTMEIGDGGDPKLEPAPPNDDGVETDTGAMHSGTFRSNNQEDQVDQADASKSDGTFIYAAYGNQLLIFRVDNGDLVLQLELPPIECPPPENYPDNTTLPIYEASEGIEVSNNTISPNKPDKNDENSSVESNTTHPIASDEDRPSSLCGNYRTPRIDSILLGDSRLALVVSGYGHSLRGNYTGIPAVSELLSTQVRFYGTDALLESNGGLTLLATKNINGYYREGFVMEQTGVGYIATFSSLNTRRWLVDPVQELYSKKSNLTKKEFAQAVRDERSQIVGNFVNQTLSELSVSTGELPLIAKLRLPIDKASNIKGLENRLFAEGYANSMVMITSFQLRSGRRLLPLDNETETEIELQQSIQFLPNEWAEVYATEELIVVAGLGYDFDSKKRASEDMTILYSFKGDGTMTIPIATGLVPGSLLNRYSFDYVDGYFRIATTTRSIPISEIANVDNTSPPESINEQKPEKNPGGDGEVVDGNESENPNGDEEVDDEKKPENPCGDGEADDGDIPKNPGENGVGGYFEGPENSRNDSEAAAGNGQREDNDGPSGDGNEGAPEQSEVSNENSKKSLEGIRTLKRIEPPKKTENSGNGTGSFIFIDDCSAMVVTVDNECITEETQLACTEMKNSGCQSMVYWNRTCPYELRCIDEFGESQCPMPSPDVDNACLTGGNLRDCLRLEAGGCNEIATLESCPLQFRCAVEKIKCKRNTPGCVKEDEEDDPSSETPPTLIGRNRIFILQSPVDGSNSTSMDIVGNATFGKANQGKVGRLLANDNYWLISFCSLMILCLHHDVSNREKALSPCASWTRLPMLFRSVSVIRFMSLASRTTQ
jgi:hypothetical protein